jgi:hypothetical protein
MRTGFPPKSATRSQILITALLIFAAGSAQGRGFQRSAPKPIAPASDSATTIDVSDSHGGSVVAYNARWRELAARGVDVRIVGPCQSACTILLAHIPRNKICVTPNGSFGFHTAKLPSATAMLWNGYQADIRTWINQHGGLTPAFVWMAAPDTFRFFRHC